MRCQAAAGAYDKPAALLELIPMIFGPIQQTTQWHIIGTQNSSVPTTRLLFAPQSSLVSSDVCSVGVMKDEEGILSHVSSTSPSLHQTHQRRKCLSVCGPSSDCFVCLTDAFPIVCGLEARCWATVPVLTIFGRLSRINGDLPTSKHKQVDWPGERSQEFLFLSMECGKCCRVWYEARIIPLSLLLSYFRDWLNSAPDVTWTLLSDMGACMDAR